MLTGSYHTATGAIRHFRCGRLTSLSLGETYSIGEELLENYPRAADLKKCQWLPPSSLQRYMLEDT